MLDDARTAAAKAIIDGLATYGRDILPLAAEDIAQQVLGALLEAGYAVERPLQSVIPPDLTYEWGYGAADNHIFKGGSERRAREMVTSLRRDSPDVEWKLYRRRVALSPWEDAPELEPR